MRTAMTSENKTNARIRREPPIWLRSISKNPDQLKKPEQALQELIAEIGRNASRSEQKRPFLPRLFHGDRAGE